MITIKNMEMPNGCYDCPFAKNKKTNDYGSFCECGVLEDYETINLLEHSKSLNCPLAEQDWTLCSKRMPEEREWIGTKKFGTTISDEVYVTLETISGERFCDHIRFQNGKFSLSKQAELDAISKGIKPIAWMPLPEPYKAESECKE